MADEGVGTPAPRNSERTSASSPTSATSRNCPAHGAASPTSRSPSRSSRSSRVASPTSRSHGTRAGRRRSRSAGRSYAASCCWWRSRWPSSRPRSQRPAAPYWWAARLGGAGWSWFTGWFNIVGLVGIVAGVGYGAAIFLQATLSLYGLDILGINFATTNPSTILHETFLLFLLILVLYTLVNIFADRLLALFNNISVWWHVIGVLVIIALIAFVPSHHTSIGFVFGHRLNNTTFHGGAISGPFFWLYVLPIGFILTMYTQTGYDASAHTAEETRGAAIGAAKGSGARSSIQRSRVGRCCWRCCSRPPTSARSTRPEVARFR